MKNDKSNKEHKHKNKKLNIDLDLSPENVEKFRARYNKEVNKGFHNRIKKILSKPKEQWTPEEIAFINKKLLPLLEEIKDAQGSTMESEEEED